MTRRTVPAIDGVVWVVPACEAFPGQARAASPENLELLTVLHLPDPREPRVRLTSWAARIVSEILSARDMGCSTG
jgi:hypothetical protein